MTEKSRGPLTFFPEQLIFQDVKFHETYTGVVSIRNNLNATVDISLRPGSVDRYTVVPEQVQIKPGELSNIEIKLKIIRYAHIKKATTQGQRDIFHIKSKFFDQKYYCTFFLKSESVGRGTGVTEQFSPQKFQFRALNDDSRTPNKHLYDVHQTSEAAMLEAAKESVQPTNVKLNVADALRKEREEQEIRNQKVLQLLESKDLEISKLTNENENLKTTIEDLRRDLDLTRAVSKPMPVDVVAKGEKHNKEVQTNTLPDHEHILEESNELPSHDQQDMAEELKHARQHIQELQALLDKQRETFATEYKRLLTFSENSAGSQSGTISITDGDQSESHEKMFEEKLEALQDHDSSTIESCKLDHERKLLGDIAMRDARISELTAQTERQELEIDNLRPLQSQVQELRQLNALAKQAALKTRQELDSANRAVKEHKKNKDEAEDASKKLKDLLQSAQTQLHEVEISERSLKTALQSAKEEKEYAIVQGKKDRDHLETQIRRLKENLKASQNQQSIASSPTTDSRNAEIASNAQKIKIMRLQETISLQQTSIQELREELKIANELARKRVSPETSSSQCSLCARTQALTGRGVILEEVLKQKDASTYTGPTLNVRNAYVQPSDRGLGPDVANKEDTTLDLHRSLANAELTARSFRLENEGLKIEISNLRHELVDASKESSNAQSRLLETESKMVAKMEALALQQVSSANAQSNELGALQRHLRETELTIENLNRDKSILEEALRDEKNTSEKMKVEVTSFKNQLQSLKAQALEKEESLVDEISQLEKQLLASCAELDSTKAKNTVLLETLETLQVGDLSEKEHRIVALNTQLLQAQTLLASAESRVINVQGEYRIQSTSLYRLESELGDLKKDKTKCEHEMLIQENKINTMEVTIRKLRSTAKDQSEEQIRMSEKLDHLNSCLRKVEAERIAAREALDLVGKQQLNEFESEREQLLLKVEALEKESFSLQRTDAPEQAHVLARNIEEVLGTLKRICFKTRESSIMNQDLQEEASSLLPVFEKFKSVIVDAHNVKSSCETDIRIAESKSEHWSKRAKILEDSLSRKIIEWKLSQSENRTLHAILNDQDHAHNIHSKQYIKRQASQIETLWEEHRKKSETLDEIQCKVEADQRSIMENERLLSTMRNQVEELQTENKELKTSLNSQERASSNGWEYLVQQSETTADSDSSIKKYFETEIGKLMLNTDPKEKILALSRQICALKLTESKISMALETAQKRNDSLTLLCAKQRAAMLSYGGSTEEDEQRHLKSTQEDEEQLNLHRDLVKKGQEIYQLQQHLAELNQELTLKQCEIDALTSKVSGLETALQGARESCTEAIQIKVDELNDYMERQELSHNKQLETFEQNELHLRQELESFGKYHAMETGKMEQAHRKELDDAIEQAVKGLPTHTQLEQAEIALEAMRDEVSRLEADLLATREENLLLNEELRRSKLQVLELEAKDETTTAAVVSLESTLQQIEKNSQKTILNTRTGNQKHRKGVSLSNKSEVSFGSLSRQLTQAKLAEADAQRRIRVAARVEVELRQMLGERDARISELKESLVAQSKASGSLKRQLEVYTKRAGRSNESHRLSAQALTTLRSKDLTENEPDKKSSTKDVARLRIELAKRQADILFLEGELAEAKASHFDPARSQEEGEKIQQVIDEKNKIRTKLYNLINEVRETTRQIQVFKPSSSLFEMEFTVVELDTQQDAIAALQNMLKNHKALVNQLEKLKSQTYCTNRKATATSSESEFVPSKESSVIDSSSISTSEQSWNRTKLRSRLDCILSTVESIAIVIKAQKKGKAPSEIAWKDICRRISNLTSRLTQDLSQLRSRLPSYDPDGSSKPSTSKHSSDTEQSSDAVLMELKNQEDRGTQDNSAHKTMQDGECQTEKTHFVSTEIKELVSALKTKSSKWKQKCKALGTALLKLKTVMTARETLLKEKLASAEIKAHETHKEYKIQIQRLKDQSFTSSLQEHHNKVVAARPEVLPNMGNALIQRDHEAELESLKKQLSDTRSMNDELSQKLEAQSKDLFTLKEVRGKLQNVCDEQAKIIANMKSGMRGFEVKLNAFALLLESQTREAEFIQNQKRPELSSVFTTISMLKEQLSEASKLKTALHNTLHLRSDHSLKKWKTTVLALRFKNAVCEFKQSTLDEMKSLQQANSRLLFDLEKAKSERLKLESGQRDGLQLEQQNAENCKMLVEKHISELEDLKIRHNAEKEALWKEASKQIEETKSKVEQTLSRRIKQEITLEFTEKEGTLKQQYNGLKLEHERILESFEKFKKVKARELNVMENRLRSMFVHKPNSTKQKRKNKYPSNQSDSDQTSTKEAPLTLTPDATNEKARFWKSLYEDDERTCTMEEKLAILGRELEFEQLEKQKLRDDFALQKHRETEQQEQIKALRRETKALKGVNEGHSIIASEKATLKSECERLKEEVSGLKEDLRSTKIESNSRQRALVAAQNNTLTDTNSAIAVALETEKQARISAETKLSSAKNTFSRKDGLITELRRKMEEVEDTIRGTVLEEVQESQERLKTQINKLTQSASRKDSKIHELNCQVDALRNIEQAQQREISEKQKQIATLKEELATLVQKVNSQSNSTTKPGLLKTISDHVLRLVKELCFLIIRVSSEELEDSRHRRETSSDTSAIASMVDLSSDEIEDLLNPRRHIQASETVTLQKNLASKLESLAATIDRIIEGTNEDIIEQSCEQVDKLANSILSVLKNEAN